jgi:hypothetical protein
MKALSRSRIISQPPRARLRAVAAWLGVGVQVEGLRRRIGHPVSDPDETRGL